MNIQSLETTIKELKDTVSSYDAYEVLGYAATQMGPTTDYFSKTNLTSPSKQLLYLCGLTLSTPRLDKYKSFSKQEMQKVTNLLEKVVHSHYAFFIPSHEEEEARDKFLKATEVAMPTFLTYFNTVSMSVEEQQIHRIQRWFKKYNDYILEIAGFNIDDSIDLFHFIQKNIEIKLLRLQALQSKMFSLSGKEREEFQEILNHMFQFSFKDLCNKFGEEKAIAFLNTFSMKREERDFFYYTESNPFESRPLWDMENGYFSIVHPKFLLNAIYSYVYKLMENSEHKQKWLKHRDEEVEQQTLELLKKLFGKSAKYYTSVFETDKSQYEHDTVVVYKRNIFIIEEKASKVKEPFRDPQKAYTRIKRDFSGDGGIQKAFDQGERLRLLLKSNEEVNLYNEKGEILTTIRRESFDNIYVICLTADNLGMIGVNLSLLLKKEATTPYPWSCNLYDLENLIETMNWLDISPAKFISYLDERQIMHEKLYTDDELDVFGFFLQNGTLLALNKQQSDIIFVTPDWSQIIDEVYLERKGLLNREDFIGKVAFLKNKKAPKKNSNKHDKKQKRKMSKGSRKKNRK
jgi:hypothetical protein